MKLLIGFLFLISIVSCHTAKHVTVIKPVENKSPLINGEWVLQMLFASDNNWNEPPLLKLDFLTKTFIGNTGCNTMSGKFTVSENYFSFDKSVATKKVCQGYNDYTFIAAISKINHYAIVNDQLELGQGEIVLMRFKRR